MISLKNLLIWTVAIAFSMFSFVGALGAIAKNKSPELALSLFPANGFAAEAKAAALAKAFIAKNKGEFPDRTDPSWKALAIKAFASEPITPDAIAVLAFANNGNDRLEIMQKAFTFSRRQELVTGWMITDSSLRDDVPAVLHYYDTLLRTNTSAGNVILPVMAAALENENFVEPLKDMLVQNPPWAGRFWRQVVVTPEALGNATDLRQMLYNPAETNDMYQDAALIKALVKDGQFEKSRQLYFTFLPTQKNRPIIINSDFGSVAQYSPVDWELFSNGEYGASISQGNLNLSAVRNSGGLFARQLVRLPKEVLVLRVALDNAISAKAKVYMELVCAENIETKSKAIRIPLSEQVVERQISNEKSACNYYWINILGRSSEIGNGFDAAINSITLSTG